MLSSVVFLPGCLSPSRPSDCWASSRHSFTPHCAHCKVICTLHQIDDDDFTSDQRNEHSAQKSTYFPRHSSWAAHELPRLLSMQEKPVSGIVLTRGSWTWHVKEKYQYQLRGIMQFCNVTRRNEIFINEVDGRTSLLSDGTLDKIGTSIQICSKHPGGKPTSRKDGYWPAYIIRAGESTQIEVTVDIESNDEKALANVQVLRVEINFVSYGPHGRFTDVQHVVLPLQYPKVSQSTFWQQSVNDGAVLPIRTHLLCHLDDPNAILQNYALAHSRSGDMIAIGETPLAIMQGRFRHPRSVIPSLLAKLACRFFHPTSSLATACGMQALIDVTGKLRVVLGIMIAALFRLVGVRGMFYRLAGEQARLIDDVSGTIPPYDQFITLGPVHSQAIAQSLQKATGLGVAIVDVNDLRRVHIVAASDKVDHKKLKAALITNPAGNADEQTPIVIVRPSQG